jgi:hypothetical protein
METSRFRFIGCLGVQSCLGYPWKSFSVQAKGAFTLANFTHNFALSLPVLLKEIFFITKRANLV